jgi:hypothetical protein
MPKQALTELSKYLDDPDENLVQTLLEAMISRHASADSSKLLAILDGRPDFQVDTREMAAYLLASMGDERALHHMTSLRSDPYSVRETILAVSWIRTPRGAETQRRLLRQYQPPFPPYRIGWPRTVSLPAGVERKEAYEVLDMAVNYANLFHDNYHYRQTGIVLEFLPDGKSARCCLDRGYYHGPLAAGGESYVVVMQKFGDSWFIVGGYEAGDWMS